MMANSSITEMQLQRSTNAANDWLRGAIETWIEHGVDWKRGGYYDALDFHTLENVADYKRLRVLARQIYVFAVGAKLQISRADQALEHGVRFLLGVAQHPAGGYSNRFSLDGEITDEKRDLYDLAFVLFALAHAYEVLQDDALLQRAIILSKFITSKMRHIGGGFAEGIPDELPRRQNPHMHLLEAVLAWTRLSKIPDFEALRDELLELFRTRFLRWDIVQEYFDESLCPLQGKLGEVAEPGHSFEWSWLLRQCPIGDEQLLVSSVRIYEFAAEHGVNKQTNRVVGVFNAAGSVKSPSARIWPQAERLKATIANCTPGNEIEILMAWRGLGQFLRFDRPGAWHERWEDSTKALSCEPLPASSLYHIANALEELTTWARSSIREK